MTSKSHSVSVPNDEVVPLVANPLSETSELLLGAFIATTGALGLVVVPMDLGPCDTTGAAEWLGATEPGDAVLEFEVVVPWFEN